ncbi:Stage II sporulation protein E [Synechococcus sp. PCC 7335]|nr:Stage II sporulation protein E [Synechococcus sp. PCC 7335]
MKVLVVDDEPDNLDLLHRTFRREFQVFKAASGAEALDILDAKGEMAVIISDQRMPKMNGTEFFSHTVERFPDTIRIVLTGYTDVEDLVSAINAGKVFKYITKPWKPQVLKETVTQAAQTYQLVKRRTLALSRALRQESLSNKIMTAVRSSLDYSSTLQSVVSALGQAATADFSMLYPIELTPEPAQIEHMGVELPEANPFEQDGSEQDSFKQDGLTPFIYYRDADSKQLAASLPKGVLAKGVLACSQDLQLPSTIGDKTATDIFSEKLEIEKKVFTCIVVPFIEKDTLLASVCLYKETQNFQWLEEATELLTHITDQVTLAISHAKLYQQIQRQSTKMLAELEVARQIQSNLLSQRWPETPGLKIQARCQPAREVGGDFFEVFVHPQGDIWLAVGDVSGKGVPAALFMSSAISVLRRELSQEVSPEPDSVMRNLNYTLSNDLISSNCFITMALVRYSAKTGQLMYANAGHVYPLVWPHQRLVAQREKDELANAIEPTYLSVRGVPLGILPNWKAEAGELTLSEGDIVLLTSDGITEATVPKTEGDGRRMLAQEGLWRFLQRQPADLDLDVLLSYVHPLEGEQEDDQTILSLEVTSC